MALDETVEAKLIEKGLPSRRSSISGKEAPETVNAGLLLRMHHKRPRRRAAESSYEFPSSNYHPERPLPFPRLQRNITTRRAYSLTSGGRELPVLHRTCDDGSRM